MSEQAAPEPTMEEILASIRRIISEDDAPAAEAEAAPAPPEPVAKFEPAPEPEPEPEPAEDVLELTERIEAPAETMGDLDLMPAAKPEPVALMREEEESLVSLPSAFAAASAFGSLTAAISLPAAGRTLEDLTRDLLKPLLKAWLDENLPRIVEA